MVNALDRRLNAYRRDLADATLKGRVAADRFVEARPFHVVATLAPVLPRPSPDEELDTQALGFEAVRVFDVKDGWAWGQLGADGYVGYLPADLLAPGLPAAPTHKVASPHALAYAEPTARAKPLRSMLFGTTFHVCGEQGNFLDVAGGGYIGARHAEPLDAVTPDYVSTMQSFLGTPYLWGGKSAFGIDCSGLVQLALLRAGIACPRDTDMQQRDLGGDLEITPSILDTLQRGDVIYWLRHVGVMIDDTHLIHANGASMATTIDPVHEVAQRARADGGPVSAVKRLMP